MCIEEGVDGMALPSSLEEGVDDGGSILGRSSGGGGGMQLGRNSGGIFRKMRFGDAIGVGGILGAAGSRFVACGMIGACKIPGGTFPNGSATVASALITCLSGNTASQMLPRDGES